MPGKKPMMRNGKKLGTRKQSDRLADAKNAFRHMEKDTRHQFAVWLEEKGFRLVAK